MPLRPEVSDLEISNLNHGFIVISVPQLRILRRCKGLMRFFAFVIPCLCSLNCCTHAVAQDQPPVQQKTTTDDSSSVAAETDVAAADPPKGTEVKAKTAGRAINLLENGLSESWNYFSSDETTQLADAWTLKLVDEQQQLICRGTPKGFLYTKAQYSNFRLSFEWKYVSDPDSNSGVLIYTQKEPRLWPTAMQVQLHQPLAGCIFPGGDATSDNSNKAENLARKIGEWNSCLIISEGGKLSVEVNGRKAGEVSGCNPSTGFIALQAEGSETHFRKLMLEVLPPPEAKPSVTADAATAAKKEVKPPEEAGTQELKSPQEPQAKPVNFDG